MSGQSAGMQIPNQNMYTPQPQSFNQQFGQQQNMGGDIYPRYGQFQNQQQMQQQVQPMQQPNNGLLQTFGGGQLGYRQPMQPQMQQPAQQPAPSLLNQQMPSNTSPNALSNMPSSGQMTVQRDEGYGNGIGYDGKPIYALSNTPMRPNIAQPSPMPVFRERSPNFDPVEAQRMQDYYAQDARDQAEMLRRMQERMGGGLNPSRAAGSANPLTVDTRPINSQDRFNRPFDVNNLNPFSVDTIPFPNRPNVAPRSAPRVAAKPAPRVAPKPAPKPAPRKAPARAK